MRVIEALERAAVILEGGPRLIGTRFEDGEEVTFGLANPKADAAALRGLAAALKEVDRIFLRCETTAYTPPVPTCSCANCRLAALLTEEE